MNKTLDLTQGKILGPFLRFTLPILFALFLQAMYGAVDLLIVGKFAQAADVSAVSTGSQIMMTIMGVISGLAMGTTVFLGHKIGEKSPREAGQIIGSGIMLFTVVGAALTVAVPLAAVALSRLMRAPAEAFFQTVSYLRICGVGTIVIMAYNLVGSIFRGMGDSRTPLITVAIACLVNIAGDLVMVAWLHLGAGGAAAATVFAQLVSVAASLLLIRRRELPVTFERRMIRWDGGVIRKIVSLGAPIALQDLLVGISFLVVLSIVNALGLTASAGVGVAEKVCAFIMLVPSSFMQAVSAFVAQNRGAGRMDRVNRSLVYAILVSTGIAVILFYFSFFQGDMLAGIFAKDPGVISAAARYLNAYGVDCLMVCTLFCFIGYFNGMEHTTFVMIQGLIGAFFVRVPVSFLMSRIRPVSLFYIGLATPCSTVVQILMCVGFLLYLKKRKKIA